VEAYSADWKVYWKKNGADWSESGNLPRLPSAKRVKTPATMTYNMLVATFSSGNFKGVICLTPKSFLGEDEGASFGSRFSVTANCWKETFALGKEVLDPHFFYTVLSKELAPKITRPTKIKGRSTAYEVPRWWTAKLGDRDSEAAANKQLAGSIDRIVSKAYK